MPPRRGPASDMIVVLADKKDSDARPVDIRRKGVGDDEITSFASKPEAMRWLASLCSQPSSVIVIGATSAAEAVAELRSKNGDKRTVAYAMPDGAIERVGSKMRLRLAESAIADTVPPVGEGSGGTATNAQWLAHIEATPGEASPFLLVIPVPRTVPEENLWMVDMPTSFVEINTRWSELRSLKESLERQYPACVIRKAPKGKLSKFEDHEDAEKVERWFDDMLDQCVSVKGLGRTLAEWLEQDTRERVGLKATVGHAKETAGKAKDTAVAATEATVQKVAAAAETVVVAAAEAVEEAVKEAEEAVEEAVKAAEAEQRRIDGMSPQQREREAARQEAEAEATVQKFAAAAETVVVAAAGAVEEAVKEAEQRRIDGMSPQQRQREAARQEAEAAGAVVALALGGAAMIAGGGAVAVGLAVGGAAMIASPEVRKTVALVKMLSDLGKDPYDSNDAPNEPAKCIGIVAVVCVIWGTVLWSVGHQDAPGCTDPQLIVEVTDATHSLGESYTNAGLLLALLSCRAARLPHYKQWAQVCGNHSATAPIALTVLILIVLAIMHADVIESHFDLVGKLMGAADADCGQPSVSAILSFVVLVGLASAEAYFVHCSVNYKQTRRYQGRIITTFFYENSPPTCCSRRWCLLVWFKLYYSCMRESPAIGRHRPVTG
jgi:predicted RNase H-like HicB family nuclease